MKENQLKMKKYKEFLEVALKAGNISKNEKNILEAVFNKKLGLKTKI